MTEASAITVIDPINHKSLDLALVLEELGGRVLSRR